MPTAVSGGIGRNTISIVSESVDETQCEATISGATCSLQSETCTAPNETRVIDGLPVTRPCWEWSRTYQCQGLLPANDCAALEARPECSLSHDECLSYDADGITCNVYDRWFQCTTPDTGAPPPPAYVCAGDLYCIDGECTSVTREASTEFKDVMVAMNVLGELRDEFDPNSSRSSAARTSNARRRCSGCPIAAAGRALMQALTRYGVFYFYSSSCSACRTFSPVMRALSDNYGLEVLAVSMDGGPNELFPNYVIDSGQYQNGSSEAPCRRSSCSTRNWAADPDRLRRHGGRRSLQRIFYLTQIEPGSDY